VRVKMVPGEITVTLLAWVDHNKWICGFEYCTWVCVGTAACPWTAVFRPYAPQAKFYRFVPFFKKKVFYRINSRTFWGSGGKHPFGWRKIKKKNGYLGDPARGQADPGSAAVYSMNWPAPVICMYVCVGTVSHAFEPTNLLVVVVA
jgi:hypothetical protein